MGLQPTNRYEKPRSGAGPRPAAPLRPPAALSTVTVGFRRCPTQCDSCSLTALRKPTESVKGPSFISFTIPAATAVSADHVARAPSFPLQTRIRQRPLPETQPDPVLPSYRDNLMPPRTYRRDIPMMRRTAAPSPSANCPNWLCPKMQATEYKRLIGLVRHKMPWNFSPAPAVIPTGLVKYPTPEPSHV